MPTTTGGPVLPPELRYAPCERHLNGKGFPMTKVAVFGACVTLFDVYSISTLADTLHPGE